MKIQNPRRQIVTALAAAAIALAVASAGQAGTVGGPQYGIAPVTGWPGVDPQTQSTSPARRPLPLESLQQVRSSARAGPVVADEFDWADAGIGAAGAALILGVLGAATLMVRRHGPLAHS